jgi:hypothetical protein
LTPERALKAARAAEAEITAGRWRGPFHGVPDESQKVGVELLLMGDRQSVGCAGAAIAMRIVPPLADEGSGCVALAGELEWRVGSL